MLLVVNTPHEEDNCIIRPVFPMVYSDRAVTSAFTYTPSEADKMSLGDFRYELAKALLWGSQIGYIGLESVCDSAVVEVAVNCAACNPSLPFQETCTIFFRAII